MKRVIQLVLFAVIIITSIIFYLTYIKEVKETSAKIDETKNQLDEETQNNLIFNLVS